MHDAIGHGHALHEANTTQLRRVRLGGADCRVGNDELTARLRISSRPPATCRVLRSGVSPGDAL